MTMAQVHVATTVMVPIDSAGGVVDKKTATIAGMLKTSSEIRVNVAGHPTVADYLAHEYAAGFTLRHMDQTYIITDAP